MDQHRRDAKENNALGMALLVMAVMAAVATMFIGRAAAVRGAKYRTVWWLVLPVTFTFAHVFALCCTVAVGFALMLVGFRDAGNYLFSNAVEFAMLSTLAGDRVSVPTVAIVLYQFIWWKLVAKGLTRHCAVSIYDWAIQAIGRDENTHPYYIRQRVSRNDPDYARAEALYLKSGHPPLLGTVLVALSGESASEYYGDYPCMTGKR